MIAKIAEGRVLPRIYADERGYKPLKRRGKEEAEEREEIGRIAMIAKIAGIERQGRAAE